MASPDWVQQFPAAVTVCDQDGVILDMNDRAAAVYEADGGRKLIGTNMLDCHPEAARAKAQALLKDQVPNTYTIEKNGVKKLIYQAPWYQNGRYAGVVEISIPIPFEMPHFVRASQSDRSEP